MFQSTNCIWNCYHMKWWPFFFRSPSVKLVSKIQMSQEPIGTKHFMTLINIMSLDGAGQAIFLWNMRTLHGLEEILVHSDPNKDGHLWQTTLSSSFSGKEYILIWLTVQWKSLYFASNFTQVFSLWYNWQYISNGSGNGLVPNRQQAITWTIAD